MKRNKESLLLKKQLRKFLKKYTFSLIFILFMANIGLLIMIRLSGRAQSPPTRMPQPNLSSQCLVAPPVLNLRIDCPLCEN
ncbi:hypothetical protein A3D77_00580 [Candidatus Gottesmanbacteria bacterium RIFCSPHIGHO2_02_FULL_39_11]|uniref:Uncharacterized protein n=1 Tax=Candidatus Gottesmanbacteria bacterium RIFCSPHIGHO2_02_FULL_39_11 TaxID=1798382 RepID=A0A1F5ZM75_9BACT|nr:MAG: hypothetical protein A3D77_00580 [Candidatus Gottesmanbacteria bacterium RIFCSPHIGHO2_02_FULL_39_11]